MSILLSDEQQAIATESARVLEARDDLGGDRAHALANEVLARMAVVRNRGARLHPDSRRDRGGLGKRAAPPHAPRAQLGNRAGQHALLGRAIAEKILGLPQDHRPDKGVPFNHIPA